MSISDSSHRAPKTGAKCGCRHGIERDNCPNCEGTGMVINFAAIRKMQDRRHLTVWIPKESPNE